MKLTQSQIRILRELVTDSGKKGNLPNAAIVVEGKNILGSSGSYVASDKDATAHAERLVIQKVCKREKKFLLPKCALITVFESCLMCFGAAYWAGIKSVYYIIPAKMYIDEIPWCGESKKLDKRKLSKLLSEPIKFVHMKAYTKLFSGFFDSYSGAIRKLKR